MPFRIGFRTNYVVRSLLCSFGFVLLDLRSFVFRLFAFTLVRFCSAHFALARFRVYAFTLVRLALAPFSVVRLHSRSFLFRSLCYRSLFAFMVVWFGSARFAPAPISCVRSLLFVSRILRETPPLNCVPFLVLLDVHLYGCLFYFAAQ